MRTYSVSAPIALAIACAASFAAGYSFHLAFGFERKAAHQAIVEAQSFQRVMAAYTPVIENHLIFTELTNAKSLDALKGLQLKYQVAVVQAATAFEHRASALELPEEVRVAKLLITEAARVKAEVASWR